MQSVNEILQVVLADLYNCSFELVVSRSGAGDLSRILKCQTKATASLISCVPMQLNNTHFFRTSPYSVAPLMPTTR